MPGPSSLTTEIFPVPAGRSCSAGCITKDAFRSVRIQYATPPDDAAMLLVEFRRVTADGGTVYEPAPIFNVGGSEPWRGLLNDGDCSAGLPALAAGEEVCARLVVMDIAGNRSEPSPELCATSKACQMGPSCDVTQCTAVSDAGPDVIEPDATFPDVHDVGDGGPGPDPDATSPDAPHDSVDAHAPDTSVPPAPDAGKPDDHDGGSGCTVSRKPTSNGSSASLWAAGLAIGAAAIRRCRAPST
jgi:hypothetical protein